MASFGSAVNTTVDARRDLAGRRVRHDPRHASRALHRRRGDVVDVDAVAGRRPGSAPWGTPSGRAPRIRSLPCSSAYPRLALRRVGCLGRPTGLGLEVAAFQDNGIRGPTSDFTRRATGPWIIRVAPRGSAHGDGRGRPGRDQRQLVGVRGLGDREHPVQRRDGVLERGPRIATAEVGAEEERGEGVPRAPDAHRPPRVADDPRLVARGGQDGQLAGRLRQPEAGGDDQPRPQGRSGLARRRERRRASWAPRR